MCVLDGAKAFLKDKVSHILFLLLLDSSKSSRGMTFPLVGVGIGAGAGKASSGPTSGSSTATAYATALIGVSFGTASALVSCLA